MDYFNKVSQQIGDFLKALSPAKRAALAFTGVSITVAIALLFAWAGNTTYSPLNVKLEDVPEVIRILREKHVSFKVDPTGRNISVPSEEIFQLRLELATAGLPQSVAPGYEIFDKQSIGTTSFVQKLNQKRALEGELMRSIGTIKGVRRARVHLAMPAKSTFVEDQKKSTASVVLDMEPGSQINDKQVFGIGNLVARAVEGMEPNDVVIVDSSGKVLSKNSTDPLAQATATQLDFRQKVEGDFEKRIEEILSRVVGEGHVVAKVSADIDFSNSSETQTMYDADGAAVLSSEKRTDSMTGVRPVPGGAVGAASNLPGDPNQRAPGGGGEIRNDNNKNNELTNFKVPETVRRTTRQAGAVRKLSVAVVVDGKQIRSPASADGVTAASTKSEAWSEDKLKEFEALVASAVGLDRKRGDFLEIKTMEFTHEDFEEANRVIAEKERKHYIQNMVVYAVIGLTIALFFMFVVRPFIKWITENTIDSVESFLPQTIEELERLQKNAALPGLEDAMPVMPDRVDPEKVEGEMIKEKIITLVDANPHKAAIILRDWLHPDTKKKEPGKDGEKSATA